MYRVKEGEVMILFSSYPTTSCWRNSRGELEKQTS